MKIEIVNSVNLNIDLLNDSSVPFFPDLVNNNKIYNEDFIK